MVKRIKQKGSKTQWHPRVPPGWLQPRLALKRFFSAVAGADGFAHRRLGQAPGAARARGDHQRELRGLRTGLHGGSGLGAQPPHSGQVLPSALKKKQFLLESLCRNLPIPSPIAASQGNDSVTSCWNLVQVLHKHLVLTHDSL